MEPTRILLVDDLEENLLALELLLRRDDLVLSQARSGLEALDLLLEHDFALALLDVQMPEMDGFELAELMRGSQRTKHVPIIFLTAGVQDRQRVFRGYEVGAVDFLFKPIDPVLLGHKVNTFVDLHRHRRERERLVEELTRSNEALDQFAHVASHDLKAPLRGIANLATWLEEDLGDVLTDDARAKLSLMRSRVHHLEVMITGVLDFATAGRNQTQSESVALAELLAEVVGLLAPPEHVQVTVVEPMPTLTTERVALQQVLMNLLGNAVKHAQKPGAAIRLEASDEGDGVHLMVIDNGPGIDPKDHERIWGLFQKASRRTKVEGSGIGLSVVKKVVESRGGRVWVESSLGHGATFHVLWPRHTIALVPEASVSGVRTT